MFIDRAKSLQTLLDDSVHDIDCGDAAKKNSGRECVYSYTTRKGKRERNRRFCTCGSAAVASRMDAATDNDSEDDEQDIDYDDIRVWCR